MVFKIKFNSNGEVDWYKPRLVSKGYNQAYGIDYTESFSPIAKVVTVRLFLAIAVAKQWIVHQVDINNAYLHGYVEEELYMNPPEGYNKA